MSKVIDFQKMLEAQRKLDLFTFALKNISYEVTSEKRLLALLVELHELINETKAFKFWVIKPEGDRTRILEEYVDVIHFILSVCSARNETLDGIEVKDNLEKKDIEFLSVEFLSLVIEFSGIIKEMYKLKTENTVGIDIPNEEIHKKLKVFAQRVVDLGSYLGFSWDEVENQYWKKWKINIARQESGQY